MTKEEILEKSRSESKGGDYYEGEVIRWASSYSVIAGWFLCFVITLIDALSGRKINLSVFAVCFGMSFVLFLLKSIKLHRKHEIVVTVFYGLAFVLFICAYIKGIIA